MGFLIFKIAVSALVVALLSELARRLPVLGGLLTAMPLTTLLVLLWLYAEGQDTGRLCEFSTSVLWGIIPTVFFFLGIIYGFKRGMSFFASLGLGLGVWMISALVHLRIFSHR